MERVVTNHGNIPTHLQFFQFRRSFKEVHLIRDLGMWNFSTLDIMSWWNRKVASFTAPYGISGIAVVALRRTKPILRNKLCAQCDDSMSILPTKCGQRDCKGSTVLITTALKVTVPWLFAVTKQPSTISFFLSNRSSRSIWLLPIDVDGTLHILLDFESWDWYFCRKVRAVDSFNLILNFRTEKIGPFSTQQCLIAFIEKSKSAVNKGKSFGALLTDLSKAIDLLTWVINKLHAYGFSLSALRFVYSYVI